MMDAFLILAVTLILLLAWSNGANDIAKGIATLVGNGTASARRAVLWGTFWTLTGGLTAILWGSALLQTFGNGYLDKAFVIDVRFILSTTLGASAWVWFASRRGLPVSTTHALLGGLIGAVLVTAGSHGLQLDAVVRKAALPLLIGPLIAIALCALLLTVVRWFASGLACDRSGDARQDAAPRGGDAPDTPSRSPGRTAPQALRRLHWLSGATTSFARGLNDAPKIAAFLVLAATLHPEGRHSTLSGLPPGLLIAIVAAVMGLGCLWGGSRVLEVLATRITPVGTASGLIANVSTSALVLAASPLGLPVSTTHVSTGSLMGVRWGHGERPAGADALRMVLFGWVVTLPVAAALAAAGSLLLGQGGL